MASNVYVNSFVLDSEGFNHTFQHAFVAIGESVDAEDPHQLLELQVYLRFGSENGNQGIAKGIDEEAQDNENYCGQYFESLVV